MDGGRKRTLERRLATLGRGFAAWPMRHDIRVKHEAWTEDNGRWTINADEHRRWDEARRNFVNAPPFGFAASRSVHVASWMLLCNADDADCADFRGFLSKVLFSSKKSAFYPLQSVLSALN